MTVPCHCDPGEGRGKRSRASARRSGLLHRPCLLAMTGIGAGRKNAAQMCHPSGFAGKLFFYMGLCEIPDG